MTNQPGLEPALARTAAAPLRVRLRVAAACAAASIALAGLVGGVQAADAPAAQPAPATAADAAAPAPADPEAAKLTILMARELQPDKLPPLSLLDLPPPDDGVAGAKLAISDNNTTGRFMKQSFELDTVQSPDSKELIAEIVKRVDAGIGFVVLDAKPETVLAVSDALKAKRRSYSMPARRRPAS